MFGCFLYNQIIMQLTPTIGLEIHVELKTKTKMFCGCLNDPDERHPNENVCPICLGYPGTLPVINEEAVKKVLRTGAAFRGKISDESHFDRKNYFYPDLPKGYQISQYKNPLVESGELNGVRIRRVHLEEDAGRLVHQGEESLVDFNRAGVPLMEFVTEPDITSGKEARAFSEELQLILRYIDVSGADMEKGQMRCEVNISLNMGTKVEIKNLNSFRAVERVIDYEIKRQTELLEGGEEIKQETRGWDDAKQKTFSQRIKEEAHDYRYFPEPDLPVLDLKKLGFQSETEFQIPALPELPQQKRERFKKEFNLRDEQIEILIRDKKMSDFFEDAVSELMEAGLPTGSPTSNPTELVFNYLTSDLVGLMNEKYLPWEELRVTPHAFGELVGMAMNKKISSRVAKDVLRQMVETAQEPNVIVKEKGLEQTSDRGFIEEATGKAINANPKAVSDYKKGKEESLQFLVGQVMRETRGKADPEIIKKILKKNI